GRRGRDSGGAPAPCAGVAIRLCLYRRHYRGGAARVRGPLSKETQRAGRRGVPDVFRRPARGTPGAGANASPVAGAAAEDGMTKSECLKKSEIHSGRAEKSVLL